MQPVNSPIRRLRRGIFRLRPEELATLFFFVPLAWALARMAMVPGASETGGEAAGYPGAGARLAVLILSAAALLAVARWNPRWRLIRDAMPFLLCANVYASLYDLIRFFHAPDITMTLRRWDVAVFGIEPAVWAQRFMHPALTDFFTFCYWMFYVLPPVLGLLLYLKDDTEAFRSTMVSTVLCLYAGYVGYVLLPATAPRISIAGEFSVPLHGYLSFLDETRAAVKLIPLTAYGAFPSLHCGVMLLSMILAWRFHRWFFWIQLPLGTGLVLGTVYLRHHWVVDIAAGFAIALFMYWAGWRVEAWWVRMRRRYAFPEAERPLRVDAAARVATAGD
jgi:membrane-associated phospholipid phosphatase